MARDQSITIEQDLQQIAEMLLLNGTLTECPGLVHGKMGIAVFFFHYAQFTGNGLFADYAMDLISEMLNQLQINSPADYEKGIAGIGVGIDYLIRNKFLSVEDDICEDFDQRMVRAVMYDSLPDFSQYNGLVGYGRYWITRLHYPVPAVLARECLLHIAALIDKELLDLSTKERTDVYCFLHDLQRISGIDCCAGLLEQFQMKWDERSLAVTRSLLRLGDSTVGNIIRAYQRNWYFNNAALQDEFDIALMQSSDLDMKKAPTSTGLLNGYAGEGLLRLTALDQTNISWMHLL